MKPSKDENMMESTMKLMPNIHLFHQGPEELTMPQKLYLVLDLDHTLLNSTRLVDISAEESYLKDQREVLPDAVRSNLFKLDWIHMMTKLRPFVHPFLKEVSSLFEMYIYTMGEHPYALEMEKLLDPGGMGEAQGEFNTDG